MSENTKYRFRFWTKACVWIGFIGWIISIGVMELTTLNTFCGIAIGVPSIALLFAGMNWLDLISVIDRMEKEIENDCYGCIEEDWEDEWNS